MKPVTPLLSDLRVERLTPSTENLSAVLTIETNCFPTAWQYPDAEDYYSAALSDKNNLSLGLKAGQATVGYLLAIPFSTALRWVGDADPDVVASDEERYYIDTIAVLPEWNGRGGASALMQELEREAVACGIASLAIHARTVNSFNALVRRLIGDRLIRARWLQEWSWADGEPYEYIEWWCDR